MDGEVCDRECDDDAGCWGKYSEHCLKCKHFYYYLREEERYCISEAQTNQSQ